MSDAGTLGPLTNAATTPTQGALETYAFIHSAVGGNAVTTSMQSSGV